MDHTKKKILMLNGCVRGAQSRTWKLAEAFLEAMNESAPEPFDYTRLDLARQFAGADRIILAACRK